MELIINDIDKICFQLKSIREQKGISLTSLSKILNVSAVNLCHFESASNFGSGLGVFTTLYMKALGFEKAIIILNGNNDGLIVYQKYGIAIKKYRQDKNITVNELSEKINRHPTSIYHFEKGKNCDNNKISTLILYANGLGCSTITLLL